MPSDSRAYQKITETIAQFEQDQRLLEADNFIERIEAIEFLELQLLEEHEPVNDTQSADTEKSTLFQRAQALKQQLDAANEALFAQLLNNIRSGDRSAFQQYLWQVEQQLAAKRGEADLSYDALDNLVNSLLEVPLPPEEPQEREPDMVYYQPSPARIILKLLQELPPSADDVFYDLGSGLGHVPILVNLMTDIPARGVEIEPVYVRYASDCLKKLGLSKVQFINEDVRHIAYAEGTIFYFYTPFQGEIMRQVLSALEAQAQQRPLRICAYGRCTSQIAREHWLKPLYQSGQGEGHLGIFAGK